MPSAKSVQAQLDLMEAQAELLAAQVRALREALFPSPAEAVALLGCGHPRAGALDITSLSDVGRHFWCRTCGAVHQDLEPERAPGETPSA